MGLDPGAPSPKTKYSSRIIQKGSWLIAQRVIDIALAFLFAFIALRRLGPANFGFVTLTQSILNLSVLMTLNIEISLSRVIPEFNKEARFKHVRAIIFWVYLFKGGMALLVGLMVFFIAEYISAYYHLPELMDMIRLGCVSLFFAALAEVGSEAALSLLHPEMRALMTLLRRLAEVIGITLVTAWRNEARDVIGVLAVGDGVAAVGFLIAVIVYLRGIGWSNEPVPARAVIRRMVKYAFPLLGARISDVAGREMGKVLLGKWVDAAVLGYYSVARLVVERINDLLGQLPATAVPVVSGERDAKEKAKTVATL